MRIRNRAQCRMSHGLPPNPMRGAPPSAGPALSPPPPRREVLPFEERSPYARAPPPLRPDYPPPLRDDDRGRAWGRGREDFDDRWSDRGAGWGDERDRRPPPPRWEDEFGECDALQFSQNGHSVACGPGTPGIAADGRPTQATPVAIAFRPVASSATTLSFTTSPSCAVPAAGSGRLAALVDIPSICRLVPR